MYIGYILLVILSVDKVKTIRQYILYIKETSTTLSPFFKIPYVTFRTFLQANVTKKHLITNAYSLHIILDINSIIWNVYFECIEIPNNTFA